jgi:bacteriocin-like protein
MNEAVNTKSEQVRELTEDELAHVSGGIIAVLIGMLTRAFRFRRQGRGSWPDRYRFRSDLRRGGEPESPPYRRNHSSRKPFERTKAPKSARSGSAYCRALSSDQP